jgi:putative hydrolase of the HAD superfamily
LSGRRDALVNPLYAADIRLITFDLDDTLWDIWPVIARAETLLHDWLVQHYPRIPERYSSLNLRAVCAEIAETQPQISHDRSAIRKLGLALAAQRVGYEDFAVEQAFDVFFAARNKVVLFEEVLPALEALHGRYRLAALTNGNADLQRIGLSHLFDFAINATHVGAAKPAPLMFREACRRAGVSPAQSVHVGDDPDHDIRGASVLGFRTVWVNRRGTPWQGEPRPDAEIGTLKDLENVLQSWELPPPERRSSEL